MWYWNGRSWTFVPPPSDGQLPTARARELTAYDPDHKRIFLFGGTDGQRAFGDYLGEVWSWAGGQWSRLPDAPIVATSGGGAMAYDSSRHELVVVTMPPTFHWGPDDPNAFPLDTWLRNDRGWRQIRSKHTMLFDPVSMIFDSSRDRILASRETRNGTEIWSWDGQDWNLTPDRLPAARAVLVDGGDLGILAVDSTGLPGRPRPVYRLEGDQWIVAGPLTTGPSLALSPAYDQSRHELVTFSDTWQNGAAPVETDDTWTWTLTAGWLRHPGHAPTSLAPTSVTLTPAPSAGYSTPPSLGPAACVSSPGRLPVILSVVSLEAGWVTLPSGTFERDEAGTALLNAAHRSDGRALNDPTYDSKKGAWLPAPPQAISPDGARYAYVFVGYEQSGPQSYSLHVAKLDGSGDQNLSGTVHLTGNWHLMGWTADGILVSQTTIDVARTTGSLIRFDPTTGHQTILDQSQDRSWGAFDHGIVWGVGREPNDPPTGFPQGSTDRLLTFDPASDRIATWYYQPQSLVLGPLGFDGLGHPVFASFVGSTTEVAYSPGPQERKVIERDPMGAGSGPNGGGQADGVGVWFGSSDGIIRFFDGSTMGQVTTLNTQFIVIAGGCVRPSSSESPLPSPPNGWNTYLSANYGYALAYPATWFDLGSYASEDEHYFSTDKEATSPSMMRSDAIWVGISANCQYWLGPNTKLISKSDTAVNGVAAIRYVADVFTPEGNFTSAIVTVQPGAYCYRISMLAPTRSIAQANVADFDKMLSTVQFMARTAPAVSPVPTIAPS
jgi:hypothetical protein